MATPHWHWRHKAELHELTTIAANHYGTKIGDAIKAGDRHAAEDYAVKFGQLVGAAERSIKSFYRGGASQVEEALKLFDELYWNTVDPDMKLRTIEGGKVVPLMADDAYQDLNRKLGTIRTFIRDGIGLGED